MKAPVISLIVGTTIVAIVIGWFYEPGKPISRPDIEIPTDIDSFFTQVEYRSMNNQGKLDFEMQSPYLEHLKVSNISLIDKPTMQIYRDTGDWQVESLTGQLFHQQNSLQLEQRVVMQRAGDNPLQVRSEVMLFEPDEDLVTATKTIEIKSDAATIQGSDAVFDLKNQVYFLKNTYAIYYRENS